MMKLAPLAAALSALLALGACQSAEPFDYQSFDKRPGLFSGADGHFVVFGGKPSAEPTPEKKLGKPG